jgi:hypothetical protein
VTDRPAAIPPLPPDAPDVVRVFYDAHVDSIRRNKKDADKAGEWPLDDLEKARLFKETAAVDSQILAYARNNLEIPPDLKAKALALHQRTIADDDAQALADKTEGYEVDRGKVKGEVGGDVKTDEMVVQADLDLLSSPQLKSKLSRDTKTDVRADVDGRGHLQFSEMGDAHNEQLYEQDNNEDSANSKRVVAALTAAPKYDQPELVAALTASIVSEGQQALNRKKDYGLERRYIEEDISASKLDMKVINEVLQDLYPALYPRTKR